MSVLSWNEIRNRAIGFTHEWASETNERAESQTFWNEFFEIFGVRRRRVALFEQNKQRLGHDHGFVDLFWPGILLVEHKSVREDLNSAFVQAGEYLNKLPELELPKYVIVSDFKRLRLYNLEPEEGEKYQVEFQLKDLPKNIQRFGFIAGYIKHSIKEEDPVNKKAVEAIARLHDAFVESNYMGKELEILLIRIVFCCFADDTGIFEPGWFRGYLDNRTSVDGSDLGAHLALIFQVLNTPQENRQTTLDEDLLSLHYVNGHLFEEVWHLPAFNSKMRKLLIDCVGYDWSKVSPAIFGSMFQSVMDKDTRHVLGAHYTSEKNILKVIKPLFLDKLWNEFNKIKHQPRKLPQFHDYISKLKFFDPACGCGNFLVVTYRELRILELEILKCLHKGPIQSAILNIESYSKIDVDSLYGIEIEEFSSRIATLAIWLTDHQMNIKLGEAFGSYYARLPLQKAPQIHNTNALKANWKEIIPPSEYVYIFGNPPFVSKQNRTEEQKQDMDCVFGDDIKGSGELDYVSAWYVKAARYIKGSSIEVSFVSTNSINQGEQVCILWKWLLDQGIKINFAHRTFKWSNDARGRAAVYCVIIGFSLKSRPNKLLYDYETPTSEGTLSEVSNINPYLIDYKDVLVESRVKPISDVPKILYGSKPVANALILTQVEKDNILAEDTRASKYIKPLVSAEEYLNNTPRWCLWLLKATPQEINDIQPIYKRVNLVRDERLKSKKQATVKLADMAYLFAEIRQPSTNYVLVPLHTSESRKYVPLSFFTPEYIVHNSCASLPNATFFHFGVMQSLMHMTWMRIICGRIKSDYRYSNDLVYNNFPWPNDVSEKNRNNVEHFAKNVIETRSKYPGTSLAILYNPLTMPTSLTQAHSDLDKAVDLCYGKKQFATELERVKFLFEIYLNYVNARPLLDTITNE